MQSNQYENSCIFREEARYSQFFCLACRHLFLLCQFQLHGRLFQLRFCNLSATRGQSFGVRARTDKII